MGSSRLEERREHEGTRGGIWIKRLSLRLSFRCNHLTSNPLPLLPTVSPADPASHFTFLACIHVILSSVTGVLSASPPLAPRDRTRGQAS